MSDPTNNISDQQLLDLAVETKLLPASAVLSGTLVKLRTFASEVYYHIWDRNLPPAAELGDVTVFTVPPDLIYLYLPDHQVHLIKGATRVSLSKTRGTLSFTDKEGRRAITSLPFTLSFEPVLTPSAAAPTRSSTPRATTRTTKEASHGQEGPEDHQD